MEKVKVPYSDVEAAKRDIKARQLRNDPDVQPKRLPSGQYGCFTYTFKLKTTNGRLALDPTKQPLHFIWNNPQKEWELDTKDIELTDDK